MIRRVLTGGILVVGFVGIAQAIVVWRNADASLTSRQDVASSLSLAIATATEIGMAQEAYVAPGQPDVPWFERVDDLDRQLARRTAAVRTQLRSSDSGRLTQQLAQQQEELTVVDQRIRIDLLNGQDLSASDLIFTEGRQRIAEVVATLKSIEQRERQTFDAARAQSAYMMWAFLGGGGVCLIAGIAAIARRPKVTGEMGSTTAETQPLSVVPQIEFPQPSVAKIPAETAVDLGAAAAVCSELSRVASMDVFAGVLTRAGSILEASGLIVWVGAGEELFAVATHGYEPKVVSRLGPIRRSARNATAAAWRSGQLGVVAGDADSSGAIAAPMFNVDGCCGVLTAEFRNGRESDSAVRAVTAMFAAQVSTLVGAWPAASDATVDSGDRDHLDPPLAASL